MSWTFDMGRTVVAVLRPSISICKSRLNLCLWPQATFWIGIETIDLAIELTLIVLPILALFKVQISWTRKSAVLIAFAIRVV